MENLGFCFSLSRIDVVHGIDRPGPVWERPVNYQLMGPLKERFTDFPGDGEYIMKSTGDGSQMIETLNLSAGEKVDGVVEEYEIVFIESGKVNVARIGYPDTVVSKNNFFLLSPGLSVIYTAGQDCRILICRFRDEYQHTRSIDIDELRRYPIPDSLALFTLPFRRPVSRFIESLTAALEDGFHSRAYLTTKYAELMLLLQEYYKKKELARFFHPMLGKDTGFRAFVLRNVNQCHSVKDLTGKYHMSEGAFRRKFIQEMGISPSTFITNNKKAVVSHELKNGSKPLKQICDELGFNSQSELTRFCRKYLGDVPSNLR